MIFNGDCIEILPTLEANSIQCVVTSPPYYGLRDYGCKGQIGLESTPGEYVEKLVSVFREVRRVLRPDGCVFLNLGDSYFGSGKGQTADGCSDPKQPKLNGMKLPVYSSLTSSHKNAILRENLTGEECYEVTMGIRRYMPELWESCWRETMQGTMPEMLRQEIQNGKSREVEGITKEVLLQRPAEIPHQNKETLGNEEAGSDRANGEQVRLLRGNGEDVPLSGSYQGEREEGLSETGRPSRCLEKGDGGRITERQIPASLLELQFGIRFIRFLSSLKLDISDIPQPLKIYFRVESGLKPKDLVGIPWRVAFALQADGWYLRQDIIWAKPNPMPESVKDRCCKSHEYIFLLTKSAKYFYDAEAVKEPATFAGKNRGVSKNVSVTGISDFGGNIQYADRNKRSVWTINTRSFKEAHFATFPPEIPTICIKAGTSEKGCCPECGIPWERVMEKVGQVKQKWGHTDAPDCRPGNENGTGDKGLRDGMVNVKETTGWRPTCTHSLEPIPCTVLDPFAGAGTTGMIAEKLDRKFIGIELNPEYAKMGERRIEAAWLPLFANLSTIGREG
jgi:DNA modification methylase